MNQTPPTNTPADDEIDLFELWGTLVEQKALILKITLACVILAAAAAFLMTPKYEARVIASFTEQEKSGSSMLAGQFGGLAEMAGVNLGGGGGKDANLAYLDSRGFVEAYIAENNLLPILFESNWNEASKTWKETPWKFWKENKPPSLWQGYKLFSEKILSISMDKKTGIVTLTILWKDREQAVEWANGLMKKANETLRQRTIEETQRSLDYLEKELQKTSVVDVQNTIYRVMESQVKTMMMANTQEQFAFKIIDPAIVVDEDAFVKPKRPLIIALGAFGGLFIGVIIIFIRKAIANRKAQQA